MIMAEPGFLVLAGQGQGGGVEFRTIKLGLKSEAEAFDDVAYPRSELVDNWASLTTDIIPQDNNELVLIISRYADQDETPWAYVAEYAKANLKDQRRNNHYSGVGLAVRSSFVPDQVVELIHDIHAAMITDLLPKREFERSMLDWIPPRSVLKELAKLDFEPLAPGFSGIQPGKSLARILYSRSVDDLILRAQNDAAFTTLSTLVLSSGGVGPSKDVYVQNEKGIGAWVKANSQPTPPLNMNSNVSETDRFTRGSFPKAQLAGDRDVVAQLRTDVRALESNLMKLRVDLSNLKKDHRLGSNLGVSLQTRAALWALVGLLLYLALVGTFLVLK